MNIRSLAAAFGRAFATFPAANIVAPSYVAARAVVDMRLTDKSAVTLPSDRLIHAA
ncbi:MAG: hypothetical protein QM711_06140 [Micropruina sp.]|uniref:hypothetical protein n=1 Tax=Micropruina sp. TaxID=2737536 RepID=UPI0039E2DC83